MPRVRYYQRDYAKRVRETQTSSLHVRGYRQRITGNAHSVKVPDFVAEARDRMLSADLTPDQAILGDPPAGRSALDKLIAKENSVFR